ncbi:MarR family transcriptional regulator [Nocardia sp. NEAU-G5]|uniref:MarR family transcriptional regulator n=1 Tax=Nocardia albiluteola TaxID=2842303 RepID=A0ABS6AY24_9NOCA|nr:helix-turn-helix domain-containing protein [Nocardia albiluteola]MBU3062961.1 MarR family transcriptional regulator [Nocardia albiluteola]
MTDFTPLQLDVLDALADCPGARTPEELADILDYSTGAVADALDTLRRHRRIERVNAWQLASGAQYALRSRLTLTDHQIDIMSDLDNAPGARTIEELAYDSGDDEDLVAETMDSLARSGYVQAVSAYRRPAESRVAAAAPRPGRSATPPDPYASPLDPYAAQAYSTADPYTGSSDPYTGSSDLYAAQVDPRAITADPYATPAVPYEPLHETVTADPYTTPATGLPAPSWLDPEPDSEPPTRRRVPVWVNRSR